MKQRKKDTVAADKEDDKVDAHHHVGEDGPSVSHNAIIHHSVPVFSCQNLKMRAQNRGIEVHLRRNLSFWESRRGKMWWGRYEGGHLEASEQSLRERVKGAPLHLSLIKVEFASKQLHAQQGEDDEEKEEQQQKGADGLHGVEQRVDQVRQSGPVSANDQREEQTSAFFNLFSSCSKSHGTPLT